MHFLANPEFAKGLVRSCRWYDLKNQRDKGNGGRDMKAKCIMVQGTASSVGKSVITAGLCRVFSKDGYRVAPFKSQNMALNSFITKDGKEMGRAQVVQAEAAGIEPAVEMNPILLKPSADTKAQVIVNGEVFKNMPAMEYHEYKPELAVVVRGAYERLAWENDIVVIEGAGSPAEINLRDKDIVNMGMAEIADAPVILVGDIDKGGVFAALAGTMLLLEEDERKRVKGVIINKFRGDIEILKPGLKMLEDIIHVPVLGVLPYERLYIDEEDSVAERFCNAANYNYNHDNTDSNECDIDVAIVKLPHISNISDFSALENIKGVRIRYVEHAMDMKQPDLIIIPGSKNTMNDLVSIRQNGIETQIKRLNKKGTIVFGICGGYQMLGTEIHDHFKSESELLNIEGMGLLNIKTVFREKKVTAQVEGAISGDEGVLKGLKDLKIKGYEIHMGTTEYLEGCIPYLMVHMAFYREQVYTGGVRNEDCNVFGTYIHGIFDNMEFTSGFINNLREKKGTGRTLEYEKDFRAFREKQYDKLEDMIRRNLEMDKIYEILGLEGKKGSY